MKTEKKLQVFHGRLLMVVALLMMLSSLYAPNASAQVSVRDSIALVKFYHGTNGQNWTSAHNWLTGPVSTWEGITVTNRKVTGIALSFHNLTGSLPNNIGLLRLTSLSLSGNSISGEIPALLILLQKLETLDLSDNQFSGSIPSTLALLTKLKSLNLSRNELTGNIPALTGFLNRLTFLDLSDNQISGHIPQFIGQFNKSLERLYLFKNQLNGSLPSGIGKLKNATEIFIYDNLLSGSLPSSIGNLDSLRFFNLSNNDLTGQVPATVSSLPQVFLFNVAGNEISGLPNLSSMSSLSQLRVSDNRLTFEDLEPNISKLPSASFYVPQDSVGTSQSLVVCSGDSLHLKSDLAGGSANNRYQWRVKPNTIVSSISPNPDLMIANVQPSHSGIYFARITNTVVRGLTIIQRPIQVTVKNCSTAGTLSVASVSARESNTYAYPNTFENEVNVDVSTTTDEELTLIVRNSQGIIMETYKGIKTNQTLKIGEKLAGGLYYLESYHGGKKEIIRILKK